VRGLDAAGITPHHRRSFVRVSQLMLQLDGTIDDGNVDDAIALDEINETISEIISAS
jgi:hypothetical protein